MPTIDQDAHAVLLPAFADTSLSDSVKRYLEKGGISILIGETREEYTAREMSAKRREIETAETLIAVATEARRHSGELLVAVDQEMGGICRLHDLVPGFPPRAELRDATSAEIEDITCHIAGIAAGLGINVFLAPILDILTGRNDWLADRTWSEDVNKVADLSAAYIRGAQRGGVAATAKHFPGFSTTTGDPAIDGTAVAPASREEIEAGYPAFTAAIKAKVEMIMVGPAILPALDDKRAALRSPIVIDQLTSRLGFRGVVMADDLDAKAVLRGDSVEMAAIDALNAGCHFLLLADIGDQVSDVASAITAAVGQGTLNRKALAEAAAKVRQLAVSYRTKGIGSEFHGR